MSLPTAPVFRLPTTWSTAIAETLALHQFEGEVTVMEMNKIQEIGDRWYARYPGKSLALSVVYPTQHRSPPEQRERLRQLIKHWEQRHLAAANVMLMDGLLGSMHRSIYTGVLMLVPPPHPAKIFSNIDEAVPWLLAHQKGTTLDVAATRATIHALCAEFLARPGRAAKP